MRRPGQSSESVPAYASHDHESRSFADRHLGRHCRGRRHRFNFNNDRRIGEAILCITQEGSTGDPPWSGQTTSVDAPPGARFHQPAALESIEEAGSGRVGIGQEGNHRRFAMEARTAWGPGEMPDTELRANEI